MRPPVEEMTKAFEREHDVKVVAAYAGSEVLLSRLKPAKLGVFKFRRHVFPL